MRRYKGRKPGGIRKSSAGIQIGRGKKFPTVMKWERMKPRLRGDCASGRLREREKGIGPPPHIKKLSERMTGGKRGGGGSKF